MSPPSKTVAPNDHGSVERCDVEPVNRDDVAVRAMCPMRPTPPGVLRNWLGGLTWNGRTARQSLGAIGLVVRFVRR